jgi:Fe-S-cluster containining protein
MARDQQGWCVAVDSAHMRCSFYDRRPEVCRRFAMGGPACREVRAT